MSSGWVYAFIIGIWACVLLPMWLRRHDEVVREHRSVDGFSTTMRTLSGRSRTRDDREVLMPAREPEPIVVDGKPRTVAAARGQLTARRRRTFLVLVVLALATGGVAATGRIPLWSIAIPAGLALLFLLHLRRQVSQQRALDRRRANQAESIARRRARYSGASASRGLDVETVLPVARPHPADLVYDDYVTEEIPVAVPVAASPEFYDAEADIRSWEPIPVPLPTYVLAPKAPRSVRVIDLSLPGSWTSGHLDEDELAAMEAERLEDARLEAEASSRVRLERAVGDGIVTGQVVIERHRAVGD